MKQTLMGKDILKIPFQELWRDVLVWGIASKYYDKRKDVTIFLVLSTIEKHLQTGRLMWTHIFLNKYITTDQLVKKEYWQAVKGCYNRWHTPVTVKRPMSLSYLPNLKICGEHIILSSYHYKKILLTITIFLHSSLLCLYTIDYKCTLPVLLL